MVSRPCPSRSVWLEPPTVEFTPRRLVGVARPFLDPPTRQIAPRQHVDATGLRKLVGRLPLRRVRPGRRRCLVPGRRVPLHQARGPADALHVDPEPQRARDQHRHRQGQTHPPAQFTRAGHLIRDPMSRGRHRRGKVRLGCLRRRLRRGFRGRLEPRQGVLGRLRDLRRERLLLPGVPGPSRPTTGHRCSSGRGHPGPGTAVAVPRPLAVWQAASRSCRQGHSWGICDSIAWTGV